MNRDIAIFHSTIRQMVSDMIGERPELLDVYTEKDIFLGVRQALDLAVARLVTSFGEFAFDGIKLDVKCEFTRHCDMAGCESPVRVVDEIEDIYCKRHGAEEDVRPVVVQTYNDDLPF